MTYDIERLTDAGLECVRKMDKEDITALKLCLLSTGALAGLSFHGRAARRIAALGCSILAAGLSLPLMVRFMDELEASPAPIVVEDLSQDGNI